MRLIFTSNSTVFVGGGAKIFLPPGAGYTCTNYANKHRHERNAQKQQNMENKSKSYCIVDTGYAAKPISL